MGPLPPSSSSWVLPAARTATREPVSTEPTKPTPGHPGVAGQGVADDGARAGDEVERPARPGGASARWLASAMTSARIAQHAVVDGAGTQTTVLPAASAGAKISAPMVYGQFHGLTTPITPSGTRSTRIRRPAETDSGQPARAALGVLAGHPEVLGQLVHLVQGLGHQRLALVQGQRAGQFFASPADRGDDLLAPAGAVERRRAGPRGPGARPRRGPRRRRRRGRPRPPWRTSRPSPG